MVYKFLILSDEVDNFGREISIDADATFLTLQDAILDSVGFTKDQMTSFFICNDEWERKTEITLIEMDSSSDEDSWVMESTKLSDLIEDEGQRLIFVFDNIADRGFFLELRSIETRAHLDKPVVNRSIGNPPHQLDSFDNFDVAAIAGATSISDEFYPDETYDPSEIDEEGFSNFDEGSDPYSNEF